MEMPLLGPIKASRTSVQEKKEKEKKGDRKRKTELVVGVSGQPMPQPLQADDAEHGPVRYGPITWC